MSWTLLGPLHRLSVVRGRDLNPGLKEFVVTTRAHIAAKKVAYWMLLSTFTATTTIAAAQPAASTSAAPTAATVAVPTPAAATAPGTPKPNQAAPVEATSALSQIPAAWATAMHAVVEDPPPPELVRDTHYIVSNESRQDLFKDSIAAHGGALLGVGSDQNYLLAGWSRPELLILFDFDQVVVNVHRVYRAFFLNAATPEAFRRLWDPKNEAEALAIIDATYKEKEPARLPYVVRAYRMARHSVPRRLSAVLTTQKGLGVRSFLDDQAQYDYIVQLFRTDRVYMVRGDLASGGCLSSIAAALTPLGIKVRVVYLSNAERYFPYTPGYKKSMLALPVDDQTVILRTRAKRDGVYEYLTQDASNFRSWLEQRNITVAVQMTRHREAVPVAVTAAPAKVRATPTDGAAASSPVPALFVIRKVPGKASATP